MGIIYYVTNRTYMIPGPGKEGTLGEDASFSGSNLLAVADGVGGWRDRGIDPSKYSRGLVTFAEKLFGQNQAYYTKNPKQLIIKITPLVVELGSRYAMLFQLFSTLVVITLDQNSSSIYTANIGDCSYAIYRYSNKTNDLIVIHKAEEQQHEFNFPFQLAYEYWDSPYNSIQNSHSVEDLDFIIVGSDGLFDNLDEQQIKKIIQNQIKEEKSIELNLQTLSKKLVLIANEYAHNKNYDSPFAKHAKKSGKYYRGGKADDITVIAAQVYIPTKQQQIEQINLIRQEL